MNSVTHSLVVAGLLSASPLFTLLAQVNSNEGNALVFQINNFEKARISDTGGNFGIGTSDPVARLTVAGNVSVSGMIDVGHTVQACSTAISGSIRYETVSDTIQVCTGSGWKSLTSTTAIPGAAAGSTGDIQFNNAGALAADTGQIHWDAANNRLGIGTNMPVTGLDVSGSIVGRATGTNANMTLMLNSASNGSQYLVTDHTGTYQSFYGFLGQSMALPASRQSTTEIGTRNSDLVFFPHSAEAARFTTNGRLGIGTTAPSYALEVSGTGAIRISQQGGTNNPWIDWVRSGVRQAFIGYGTPGADFHIAMENNNRLNILASTTYVSGNLGVGTNAPDSRLHLANNVATGALDNFSEYQILLYDSNSATTSYGLGIRGNTVVANTAQNHDFDVLGVNFARISNAIGSTGMPGLKIGNGSYGWHSVVMDGSTSTKSLGILYGGSADNLLLFSRYGDNAGAWEANPYSFDLDAPGGGFTVDSGANLYTVGNHMINNAAPFIVFQDTDQRNGVIHVNGSVMYFLSGNGTNGTSWTANGSYWPLTLNLNTDEASFGGNVSLLEGNLNLNGNAIVGSAGTVLDANGGWVRTYGTSGWFNGTYGGGMYMIDATWVRAYNSKSLWSDTVVGSQGGFTAGFSGTFPPDSGGAIIAGNTGIGTASPKSRLDIADSNGVGAMTLGKEGGFIGYNAYYNGGWKYKTNGYAYILRLGNTGALEISSAPNNTGGNDAAMTPRMNVAMFNAGNMTTYGTVTTCTLGGGSGATNCTSDGRLKDRIKPVESAIEKLERINPVTFHWKDKSKDQREFLGLIAQNVETVFPQVVDEVSDTTLGEAKTLDYAAMVVPAIAAIKELNTKLEAENADLRAALKAANDNYDARLRALEQKVIAH